ncbi:ABC transporter permease subunit [Feifania hominis]|uniref:ABC transporter permease n=1 Tax=Feifania hominis TaxID=2763660 RepID=A0A926DDK8_9FIRM|nr:ABC transporter permease [Feifania hominis]
MFKYILKRLLITIPILLCVVFIVFTIMQFTPGDPASSILGATATQEQKDQLNHELGYDQPFFTRFFNYVGNILKGDFGTSYRSKQPVVDEIATRFPTTLKLALFSMLISAAIGITLGVVSAVKQYSPLDTTLTVLALFFAAVPGFWLGLMLIMFFAVTLGILPTSGMDSWRSMILPLITLSAGGIASLLRITRSAMLETIRQDYIRTARAKGASEKIVILRHALKNALLPVITVLGMNFSGMLGGAVIAETVFAMPGVGQYVVEGIRQKNDPVVLTSTLLLATLFCLIMLAIDIIYAFVDPRIKARISTKKG